MNKTDDSSGASPMSPLQKIQAGLRSQTAVAAGPDVERAKKVILDLGGRPGLTPTEKIRLGLALQVQPKPVE